ncbi:MAG: beta-galactosidase, partial [Armatimonadetes bacterium]|nr:beta-galactosidase [Armatimonadota bacterium]
PGARLRWEVFDSRGRLLAATETPAGSPRASLELTPPVVVSHHLDVSLLDGQRTLAHARRTFTIPRPHDLTDYTALLWTYPGGEPVLRQTMADCYQHGAGLQDLCHMGGYDDRLAAREYAVAAASGLRLIPYVTRIAGEVAPGNQRSPGLHDPAWRQRTRDSLTVTCRQAAPYAPAAFTLGDENYLVQGTQEVCLRPDSIAAFRDWLGRRYGNIEALNAAWGSNHAGFESITPMLLGEAVARQSGFAPWMDFRRFMDHSFADAHEDFADTIRQVVPGARVGWDGFLGYQWQSGYDFARLTERLELNQSYSVNWLMGELIRSFKRPNALVGKWGNAVADNREGFDAWVWDGLLSGDNSVWWWTSWGCDYIPFNPDLSLNAFGEGFFRAVRETSAGPGKLLLHAQRDRSGIGVLYSQDDLFAATLAGELTQDKAYAGSNSFLGQHRALLETLHDLGYQYHHLSTAQLEAGDLSVQREPVFILPLAACLSDQQVAALRRYVEAGGTLLVDGRAGLLTGP